MTRVHDAVEQWFVALAMFAANPTPFAELYSHADDVTYMGAEGYLPDWMGSDLRRLEDPGGREPWRRGCHGEEIHVIVEGTMAMATHLTEGTVKTSDGKTIDQRVRETSVFRKEDGAWRMIGHQADNYPVWVDVVGRWISQGRTAAPSLKIAAHAIARAFVKRASR